MEFIKTKDSKLAVSAITARMQQELASGKKVLWLLSGGSAISAEVEILQSLQKKSNTENLAIILMDERFGVYGHADSNWQQMLDAGAVFEGMYAIPVMSEIDKTLKETVVDYEKLVKVVLENADFILGVFGIGADGHTAGMLPKTPAVKQSHLVVGYSSPPFERITLTKKALQKLDVAYVLTFGEAKKPALINLKNNNMSFTDMPSKVLWDLPEVYVYNDQVGDK